MASELVKRVGTGIILIPVAIFIVFWENTIPFAVALYILVLLGNREFLRMMQKSSRPISALMVYLGAVAIPPCFYFNNSWMLLAFVMVGMVLFAVLLKMFTPNPTEKVIEFLGINVFVASFFPVFFCFLWKIRLLERGEYWIFFLLVAIWCSDSFAYFIGRAVGKTKIVPKISPNKSLQGFIAGILFGSAAAITYYYFLLAETTPLNFLQIFMITIDIVVAGILGDLFESMLKRDAGVKDSGSLIPGHGGVLDRFDSLLLAAPILYMYLQAWG